MRAVRSLPAPIIRASSPSVTSIPGPSRRTRNDAIVLRIGEPILSEVDPGFNPWIRVFGPDGAQLGSQSGARSAQINLTAPLTGTYTVVVTSAFVNVDDGHYLLTLVKVPGAFDVPPGDEGGPITRTAADRGDIALGDLDPWTFTAASGNADRSVDRRNDDRRGRPGVLPVDSAVRSRRRAIGFAERRAVGTDQRQLHRCLGPTPWWSPALSSTPRSATTCLP